MNYNPDLQVASRACMHLAGPVHVNFPFDAPLKPDFAGADLQAMQRAAHDCFALGARNASIAAKDGTLLDLGPLVGPAGTLPQASIESIERLLWKRPCLVLAGEGSCETVAEAEEILAWARKLSLPVLADPLELGPALHRRPAHHRQLRQPLRARRLSRARGGHPLRSLSCLEERNRPA